MTAPFQAGLTAAEVAMFPPVGTRCEWQGSPFRADPCPFCGAAANRLCHTAGGRILWVTHRARTGVRW